MPEQVKCPSCSTALRVPDTLLGKNVKCPKCQTTFLAELEELDQPEGIVHEPESSAARRRRPSPPQEEELKEFPDEEDEEEERPRPRGRRRRSTAAARSAVAGPAISLMIVGGIGIVVAIAYLVMQAMNIDLARQQVGPQANDPAFQAGLRFGKTAAYVGGTAGIFWGIFVLVGAVMMKQLKSYGLAMTTCILAMVPCNCCCVLGLPFGIWGLTALNKPGVKDAFS
jgi:predicted Zn finger-like uncharacterized protein